jgi:RsiW-degrading membrane proteinase PrsW (M82 family)
MLSITFVNLFHSFLPFLYNGDIALQYHIDNINTDFLINYSFFQVAITEELSKWLTFILIYKISRSTITSLQKESPISTMVYYAMVSLGFAVLENIQYGLIYGTDVLYLRTTSAVLLHTEVGLMTGYWLAMINVDNYKNTLSVLGVVFKKYKNTKAVLLTIIGLSTAIFVHGLYDLNLFIISNTSLPIMYLILGLGAFITYIGACHLVALTKK